MGTSDASRATVGNGRNVDHGSHPAVSVEDFAMVAAARPHPHTSIIMYVVWGMVLGAVFWAEYQYLLWRLRI